MSEQDKNQQQEAPAGDAEANAEQHEQAQQEQQQPEQPVAQSLWWRERQQQLLRLAAGMRVRLDPLIRRAEPYVRQAQQNVKELREFLAEDIARPTSVGSPEEIHSALNVVYRRNWIPIYIMGGIIGITLLYMFFGAIPITAKGNAMFVTRGTVVPFQSPAGGQISEWRVKVGDYVTKGQLIAVLDQPLNQKQLDQELEKLSDLETRNTTIAELEANFNQLEKDSIARKRIVLQNQISSLETEVESSRRLADSINQQKLAYLDKNHKDVEAMLSLHIKREAELADKLDQVKDLRSRQLATADALLRAEQSLNSQRTRVSDLEVQLLQFNLKRIQAVDTYLGATNRVMQKDESLTDLILQLESLNNREAQIEQQYSESQFQRQLEMGDINRSIERLRQQLSDSRNVLSEYEGRILELTASEGALITKGNRLGTIDAAKDDAVLEAVAYFKLSDGKKIKPGMRVRLTPATVQRERFGGLIAEVTEVSSYPVTADGAATVIGNASVARSLTKDHHQIEIYARLTLDDDTDTGYEWDISDGPAMKITTGTIATAFVDVKNRPPLTFVLPVLRNWEGFF
jgi:HlyD family secretion protein